MGRPPGVCTRVMAGGAYVRGAVTLLDWRGVTTATATVPTPRGTVHLNALAVPRDACTTAHSASPTSTATGQGGKGKPLPLTVISVPPGVPTVPALTTPVTAGPWYTAWLSPLDACPPTTAVTVTFASSTGGAAHWMVVDVQSTTAHGTLCPRRAAAWAHVRVDGLKTRPREGSGGAVTRISIVTKVDGAAGSAPHAPFPKLVPKRVMSPPSGGSIAGDTLVISGAAYAPGRGIHMSPMKTWEGERGRVCEFWSRSHRA
jgi:hypothetical protein